MIFAAAVLAAVVTPAPSADVRISPDSLRIIAGGDSTSHKLTVATSDGSRNIATQFALRCGEREWTWSLPQLPRNAISIAHPAGDCTLAISTDGYKSIRKVLAAPNLGIVYLHRLPVISGTITDATTSSPIAHAEIVLPSGDKLATTDAMGRFRAVIDRPWPSRLRVEAAGRATRTVIVPKAVADTDLSIALSRGGTIALQLAPPLGQEDVQWEARRIIDNWTDEKVRGGSIAAGQSEIAVEGLDPGRYRILVLGEGPLQRIAVPVEVVEGTATDAIVQIEPARLELEVLRADKPLGGAELEMIHETGAWRSNLVADDGGRIVEEIWQSGSYSAGVPGWSERRTLDGETISWKLDVPDRIIRGKIKNIAGQVLTKAWVLLAARSGDRVFERATHSGDDGTFEFKTVDSGTYTLTVRLQGYETLQTPPAPLAAETHLEMRDLVMRAETGHTLRALNSVGAPIASALVYVLTRSGTRRVGYTGDDGRITLPLAMDEYGVAFVLPRSGSLAMTRFASMSEAGALELIVTVPEGAASLEVRAESTEGEPIGGMSFLMRVNGVLLPLDVKEAMTNYQGLPFASDAQGRLLLSRLPQGRYEIWPLASRADFIAVNSPTPPPAPVNVILMAGHQVAKMVFEPK